MPHFGQGLGLPVEMHPLQNTDLHGTQTLQLHRSKSAIGIGVHLPRNGISPPQPEQRVVEPAVRCAPVIGLVPVLGGAENDALPPNSLFNQLMSLSPFS
jgi:hypothetical protein